jgi:hypothetical protein
MPSLEPFFKDNLVWRHLGTVLRRGGGLQAGTGLAKSLGETELLFIQKTLGLWGFLARMII